MKKTLLAIALMASMAGVSAKTVVTVNGTKIDSAVIDRQVADLSKQSNGQVKDSPELRKQLTNNAVVRTVIIQEAKKRKLDNDQDYKNFIAQAQADADKRGVSKEKSFKQDFEYFKDSALVQAFSIDVLKKNPVTEQDIRQEYNQFSSFYKGSQEVQLAEIVTRNEEDANKALAELKKGKKFADVAKKHTIDEVGKQNGGMHKGYVNTKDLPPELSNVVGNLKKGQYTQPINGGNIWAIFSVQESRPAQIPTFDQVKDALKAQLEGNRVDQAVAELLQKATIK